MSSDSEDLGNRIKNDGANSNNDLHSERNNSWESNKGPRTPGSPVSNVSESPIGSPGPRSPSPISRSPRSPSPSPHSRTGPRSPSPVSRSAPRSPSPRSRSGPRSPSPHSGSLSPNSRSPQHYAKTRPRSPSPILRSGPRSPSPRSRSSPRSPSPISTSAPRTPSPGFISGPRSPSAPRSPSPVSSLTSRSPSGSQAENNGSPQRRPRSPPDLDDGRSNISSGSSIMSQESKNEEPNSQENNKSVPGKTHFSVPNAEDLSDVSDIDDSDGLADEKEEEKPEVVEKRPSPQPQVRKDRVERSNRDSIHMDDGEQLDFEAEDQPDIEREDGEIETVVVEKKKIVEEKEEGEDKSGDEGELKEDGAESLEEGEVTDEGDPKPEKPPICRFYSRGACTWGANCRFLHPGVTDKGNYTMFEVTRPMVAPSNGLGMYPPEPRPYSMMMPPARTISGSYGAAPRREDPAGVESAWERGLRQAKELMRKSSKRKETDMDFEEKKMNLSIGQDEMDKENDYYTRPASPLDDAQAWATRASPKVDAERRPAVRVVERYEDIIPDTLPAGYDRYEYRRGYDKPRDPEYAARREQKKYYTEEELLARKANKKMVREVIVQRDKSKRTPSEAGRRPDEWQDPWMRSKSPGRKGHRPRNVSFSSRSSSYSGSSSRTSSGSTYSTYSRSRSRSGSRSGSGSPSPSPSRPRRPRSPPSALMNRMKMLEARDPKFKPMKLGAPAEKPASMLMNPPAPSPRRIKDRPISPTTAIRKVGLNPPAPTPKLRPPHKHGSKGRPRKSRSSSSGSSGSSSDSSHSSSSSSSSSRGGSPPGKGKKPEPNDRLGAAALVKSKGLGGVPRAPGQKPVGKSAKPMVDNKRDKPVMPPMVAGKKRPAEEPPTIDPEDDGGKGSSRREELLKQLKAVEDAIAKKRSKI